MEKRHFFLVLASFFLFACSSKSPDEPPNPDPGTGGGDNPATEMKPNLASVRTFMVDKQATAEAAALFYNLKTLSKTQYLIGQHENESVMSNATGGMTGEAIYSTDFMFITDYLLDQGSYYVNQQTNIRNKIKAQYRKGEVITMCWHYRDPIVGEQYSSTTGNFYWTNSGTGLADQNPAQQKVVPRLIPGGSQHDRLKASLDIVANFANTLVDDNGKMIPVIFRPWHEQSGDWFWWGISHCNSPAEYIALWQFTVQYLRDTKGIHHFLYAYSPNGNTSNESTYLTSYGYPGDDYVDIFGVDYYLTNTVIAATQGQLDLIVKLAKERNKIAAFTETGYDQSKYAKKDDVFTTLYAPLIYTREIAYMAFWSGSNYIPSNTYTDFTTYVKTPRVVTSYNMPNMFVFPAN